MSENGELLDYKEFTEGSKSDVLLVKPPEEPLNRDRIVGNLEKLPDHTLTFLKITRGQLSRYVQFVSNYLAVIRSGAGDPWSLAHKEELLKYVNQYGMTRRRLQSSGDKEGLGNLHHSIDQVYARLIGYRSNPPGKDIPLEQFRIYMQQSVEAFFWAVAAGLVMFAEERQRQGEAGSLAEAGVVERWKAWLQEERQAEELSPDRELLLQFTANILEDWDDFVPSWNNPNDHDKRKWPPDKNMSWYAKQDTPEGLYTQAEKEKPGWWTAWEGDIDLHELLISLPCWMKRGYKDVLTGRLRNQYGNAVDLGVLDCSVTQPPRQREPEGGWGYNPWSP